MRRGCSICLVSAVTLLPRHMTFGMVPRAPLNAVGTVDSVAAGGDPCEVAADELAI